MKKFITSDLGSLVSLYALGLIFQVIGKAWNPAYYLAIASFAAIPIRGVILLIRNK